MRKFKCNANQNTGGTEMTKQTIEVDVPNGYEISKIEYFSDSQYIKVRIKEKIQPRRIVLEETNEVRRICFGEWYESQDGKLMRWPYGGKTDGKHKVWREVKETDIPLTNEDDKLSLSVDECKDLQVISDVILSRKIQDFIRAHKHD